VAKKSSKTLKRGNIVWLISGSSPLAVTGTPDKDGMVTVEWHDDEKKARTHNYHVDLLTLAPPEGIAGKDFWAGLAKQVAKDIPKSVERRVKKAVDEG
jgi:hypothetical protein